MKTNGKNGILNGELYTGPRQKVLLVNGEEKIFFFLNKSEAFTSMATIAEKFDVSVNLLIDKYNETTLSIMECIASLKETTEIPVMNITKRELEDVSIPTDLTGFYRTETPVSTKSVKNNNPDHIVDATKSAYLSGIPHRGIICRYKGVEYISQAALERAYNLPSGTICHARIRHPEIASNINAIMNLVLNRKPRSKKSKSAKKYFRTPKPIVAYGISYPSQKAMSRELGMQKDYVAQCIRKGFTPEEIVDKAKSFIAKKNARTA